MSFLNFLKQLLVTDMPMQIFVESHNPQSVYEVEQLQRKYEYLIEKNHSYI